ncbi:uncharacterized protein FOMMEDRAFT_21324 [Fomitiporia mediterranea MF3/22]|uniref:uncharacterized protein n=1 Tax=Fomitiporia mediterranea (strain MF3/22) TaxID=694068 RepID=UPI000440795C|nr:uncharacterized protein FOMMEDRAFT_21324 [Fomitiporia mediterranea MF3/22]EJD00827.1 hypothetical protein FOMMEDRAFT_21324 [Fomitiporia mediterranea MF3/22]
MDPANLDTTMGAMYIGVTCAGILYGVSCVQMWLYYANYDDVWLLKSLVAAVFLCDSMNQAFIIHMLYKYLVMNFENPLELGSLVWSLIIEVLFNSLVGLLVQSFFTYRIYRLSGKNVYLTCLVAALVLAEFGLSLAFTVEGMKMSTFTELLSLRNLSRSVNALAAVGNVSIAISMVVLLRNTKTGLRRPDSIVNRLIIFSLNTGILTSLCAIFSLITISAFPGTLIYSAFFFVLGRVYANSFMVALNVRRRLQKADVEEAYPIDSTHLTYIFDHSTKHDCTSEIISRHQ